MKLRYLWIAFVLIFLMGSLFAQSLTNLNDLGEDIEEAQEILERLSDSEERVNYLKTEWTKILEDTKAGPYLKKTDDILSSLDPLFHFLLGVNYSLSWVWILSLTIFIVLTLNLRRLSYFFEPFLLKYGKYFSLISFLASILILILFKIPRFFAWWIINFFSSKGEWYFQLFAVIGVWIGIILIGTYTKSIEGLFFALKEKRDKLILEQKVEKVNIVENPRARKELVEEIEQEISQVISEAEEQKETAEEKEDKEKIREAVEKIDAYNKYLEEFSKMVDEMEIPEADISRPLSNKELGLEEKPSPWWKFWKT